MTALRLFAPLLCGLTVFYATMQTPGLQETAVETRSIALTFDDAPRESTARFDGPTRAAELIASLREADVPRVAIFANTVRLDDEGRRRLETYAAAGHLIANHTHSHLDLNAVAAEAFVADIVAADERLSALPTFVRLFRFPFLYEGNERAKRDYVRRELARLGYRNGYITVNTFDWHMDWLFQRGLREGRLVDEARLRQIYLDVVLGCVEFTDALARETLGRSPRHVLLLHENDLNALFVADLVAALRERGWTIVAPEYAFEDEIAAFETDTIFPGNPGRIGEIAYDRGFRGPLSHESCNREYLEDLFVREGPFAERGIGR